MANDAKLTPDADQPPVGKVRTGSTNALADEPWRGVWRDILGGSVVRSIIAIERSANASSAIEFPDPDPMMARS